MLVYVHGDSEYMTIRNFIILFGSYGFKWNYLYSKTKSNRPTVTQVYSIPLADKCKYFQNLISLFSESCIQLELELVINIFQKTKMKCLFLCSSRIHTKDVIHYSFFIIFKTSNILVHILSHEDV